MELNKESSPKAVFVFKGCDLSVLFEILLLTLLFSKTHAGDVNNLKVTVRRSAEVDV